MRKSSVSKQTHLYYLGLLQPSTVINLMSPFNVKNEADSSPRESNGTRSVVEINRCFYPLHM